MCFICSGYHGAYCPGQTIYQIRSNSTLKREQHLLPKGVGLTLDIVTGDLKLPVWDFNFEGATDTWTDPNTGATFLVPKGLTLSVSEIDHENRPVAHVFKTEADLVAVWNNGYDAGTWLGGEFGYSKSISNLYTSFFNGDSITSINQKPHALYRLTLQEGWESKFNQYVKAGLKQLPEVYDSNIYNR